MTFGTNGLLKKNRIGKIISHQDTIYQSWALAAIMKDNL